MIEKYMLGGFARVPGQKEDLGLSIVTPYRAPKRKNIIVKGHLRNNPSWTRDNMNERMGEVTPQAKKWLKEYYRRARNWVINRGNKAVRKENYKKSERLKVFKVGRLKKRNKRGEFVAKGAAPGKTY